MADCKIVNASVKAAVEKIKSLADQYAEAGTTFETAFKAAIADMAGETKEAIIELFDKSYKTYVTDPENGMPAMIMGLSMLLEGNRSNFETADTQIADSIRNGGQ